jgi:hypothetical protein
MNPPAHPFQNRSRFRLQWYAIALRLLVVAIGTIAGTTPTLRAADSQASSAQSSLSRDRAGSRAQSANLTFSLQSRGEDGKPLIREESIDPRRIGIVVVDPWNFHWCKTATMRVDALIPRINRSLAACRDLGMTLMLCPSDVVDHYVGWPQREIVLAME